MRVLINRLVILWFQRKVSYSKIVLTGARAQFETWVCIYLWCLKMYRQGMEGDGYKGLTVRIADGVFC